MRNIYLLLTLSIIIMVTLLIFAFVYFEKGKHQSFFYLVENAGIKSGYVKIDRYSTEDKIIFKSTGFYPKEQGSRIIHEKLVFDKNGFLLHKYIKDVQEFGTKTNSIRINNNLSTFDFLAVSGPRFTTLDYIPHERDISVFNAMSPLTYIPFLEQYDFSLGGAQSFNALHQFLNILPPAKGKLVFTSTRDEYITSCGKKIKTEHLTAKAKKLPPTSVWVSKLGRSLSRIRVESKDITITRVKSMPKFEIKNYVIDKKSYDSREILIPSGSIALSGTIDAPGLVNNNKIPCVLLVTGEGAQDREESGLYTDLSDTLARAGYAVLRYDKRGIGKSQGDYLGTSIKNDIEDVNNALTFLLSQDFVDRNKAFVVTHSTSCAYVQSMDLAKNPIRAVCMLAAKSPSAFITSESEYNADRIKTMTEIDSKYPVMLEALKKNTLSILANTSKDYASVYGMRVFITAMRELEKFAGLNLEKITVPILCIYGKQDKYVPASYVQTMEKEMNRRSSKQLSSTVYFRSEGHWLGKLVDLNRTGNHYEANKEVLETIRIWLDTQCEKKEEVTQNENGI